MGIYLRDHQEGCLKGGDSAPERNKALETGCAGSLVFQARRFSREAGETKTDLGKMR